MGELAVGSIVLVDFPYSTYLRYKKRPALVIAVAEFDNYILCQITSKKPAARSTIALNNQDFAMGGLPHSSYIRPDKIYTVDKIIIERGLGMVSGEKLQQVGGSLAKLLGVNQNAK